MCAQIAIITLDVHTNEITVARVVLNAGDLNGIRIYSLALRCFRSGTLGELECAVCLLFRSLQTGSVGINADSLIDVHQILFGVAAGDGVAVFINSESFLESLVLICRNCHRNVFRANVDRVVISAGHFTIYCDICTAVAVLDNVHGLVLSLAGVVVSVALRVVNLYGALVASTMQTVVAGGTGYGIVCAEVIFSVGVFLCGGCSQIAVCGIVQIHALVLPVFCPCQSSVAVDVVSGVLRCADCNSRDRLCGCEHCSGCNANELFPVFLLHKNLLKCFSATPCKAFWRICAELPFYCV